jgi:putative addiction module CopG family antidote
MYGNQSEVFRAALRLFHEKEQENEARLAALRREVGIGLKQILDGEADEVSAEEFITRGKVRLKEQGN